MMTKKTQKWSRKQVCALLDLTYMQLYYAVTTKGVVKVRKGAQTMFTAEMVRDVANHFLLDLPPEVEANLK